MSFQYPHTECAAVPGDDVTDSSVTADWITVVCMSVEHGSVSTGHVTVRGCQQGQTRVVCAENHSYSWLFQVGVIILIYALQIWTNASALLFYVDKVKLYILVLAFYYSLGYLLVTKRRIMIFYVHIYYISMLLSKRKFKLTRNLK